MAYNLTRVALFGAIGFILAASIILTVEYLPFIPVVEAKGWLIVKVKDAPADLTELNIVIDGVKVHKEGDEDGSWIEMGVLDDLVQPFDLLTLTDYAIVLAAQPLPAGSYTEIRLHIESAVATIVEDTTSTVQLKVVANGWLMVKVRFTVGADGVTILELDIEVNENSIVHSETLHPVVKATVEELV